MNTFDSSPSVSLNKSPGIRWESIRLGVYGVMVTCIVPPIIAVGRGKSRKMVE